MTCSGGFSIDACLVSCADETEWVCPFPIFLVRDQGNNTVKKWETRGIHSSHTFFLIETFDWHVRKEPTFFQHIDIRNGQ